MRQRHFIMADDPVIEIGDIHRSIGSKLQVDGPEPRVVAHHEIGLFDRLGRRAVPLDRVAVDTVRNDVADEEIVAKRLGKMVGGVVDDAGDGRRAVIVRGHLGTEAEAVVRLAEARIPSPAEKLIDRVDYGNRVE